MNICTIQRRNLLHLHSRRIFGGYSMINNNNEAKFKTRKKIQGEGKRN